MATIGNKDGRPFAERGTKKSVDQWGNYPRITQSPQQFGFGVMPQNMVKPRDGMSYRAGCAPKSLNVAKPGKRTDSLEGGCFFPAPRRRQP